MKKKLFLFCNMFLLFFSTQAAKADPYSDFFAGIALNQDEATMKRVFNAAFKPIFSGFSAQLFAPNSMDYIGLGGSGSFITFPLSEYQADLPSSVKSSVTLSNLYVPLPLAYIGGRIPFTGFRVWARAGVFSSILTKLSRDVAIYGCGFGKEVSFLDSIPLVYPKISLNVVYHMLHGLPGITRAHQAGLNLQISLKLKLLASVTPYVSIGAFYNDWAAKFDSSNTEGFQFSEGVQNAIDALSSPFDLSVGSSSYGFPVGVGFGFSLGLFDLFAEYMAPPHETTSVALGFSF